MPHRSLSSTGNTFLGLERCACVRDCLRRIGRHGIVATALVFTVICVNSVTAAQQQRHQFNIPQQRADRAINKLAQQADTQILYPYDVAKQFVTNRVAGEYTLKQAIVFLLKDSGLIATFSKPDRLAIKVAGENLDNNGEKSPMHTTKKGFVSVLSAIFAAFSGQGYSDSAQAAAQDSPGRGSLEEIIVTAQKRSESLQDVPISVTAITSKAVEDMNISEWRDLQIPGVYIGEAGDTRSQFIRGIGTVPLERGFEMAVPLYSDGIYYGRGRHNALGFWDIAGIEVLKGPQPTHVGKNAIGGAVLVKSAKPTEEFEAKIALGYEFDAQETVFDGVISGPVSDGFNARLAVKYRDMDGWGTNIAENNAKVPEHEDYWVRGSFVFQPRDNIEIFAKLEYADLEQIGGVRARFNCAPGAPLDPTVGGECNLNDKVTMEFDPTGVPSGFFGGLSGTPVGDQLPLRIALEHKAASVMVNWDFDTFMLTSTTGYYEYENEVFVKPDFNTAIFPLLIANTPENFDQFSQELRLVSTTDGPIDWLVGAYFDTSSLDTNSFVAVPVAGIQFHDQLLVEQDSWAVFGELVYHVSEQLSARFGARFSEVDKDSHHPHNFWLSDLVNDQLIPLDFLGYVLDESQTNSDFQPAITLEWSPNDSGMYYLSWKEGFKAGTFAINGRPPSGLIKPETVTAWEAGAKYSLWDGAATLNLAAFRSEYEDLQVSTFNPSTNLFLSRNAEESRSQGIEVQFAWAASETLTLQASGLWLDAEYLDFSGVACFLNPRQTPEQGCDIPPGGNALSGTQNLAGKPLPYSPDVSAQLSLNYDRPLTGDLVLSGYLSFFYTDEFHITSRGDKDVFQKAYTKVDARIAVGSADGVWEVALFGRNLTDEITAHMIEDTPGDELSNWANIDRPRQIGLQLRYAFD